MLFRKKLHGNDRHKKKRVLTISTVGVGGITTRNIILVMVVVFLLRFSLTAYARAGEKTSFSVGLSVWNYGIEGSKDLWMYGPVLSARGRKWNSSFSYLLKERWDCDRSDLNFIVGYDLNPEFGFFFGYKSWSEEGSDWKKRWNGYALGARSSLPFGGSGLAIYGSVAYLPYVRYKKERKWTDWTDSETDTGALADVGIQYAFPNRPVTVCLGYRWQRYDIFPLEHSGYVVTAYYTF